MKTKILMTLTLLLAMLTQEAWAGDTYTVRFEANGNTVDKTGITLPHIFSCEFYFDNENGELDEIIQELYGLTYGGYCDIQGTPSVTGGSDKVTAGMNDDDLYIEISAPFEGTATVTGTYYAYSDELKHSDKFDFNLTISIPTHSATFATGSGGTGWTIDGDADGTTPYEGKTVTVSYSGPHKVKSVTVWPKNAVHGKFSVSSTKQVYFANGNLQAVFASAGTSCTWQFATNQWDYIGNAKANTSINGSGSVSAAGTVDLFGWVGTSSSYDNYGIWNNTTANSYGNTKNESLEHDWGHNAITNGGNTADMWRTLTREEWGYMLSTRSGATVNGTTDVRFAKATIRTDETTVKGLLLFPDGVTFDAGEASWGILNDGYENYTTTCTAAQWTALEAKGCVFLPAAGNRTGATVSDAGSAGAYWTATGSDNSKGYYAYRLYFGPTSWGNPQYYSQQEKSYGHSVRLVRDVE